MITAEEFLLEQNINSGIENVMINFAKMHVIEALKAANEKAKNCHIDEIIDDEVLKSYNLDNIK